MAALLSGEMKDTVDLNPAGAYGVDPLDSTALLSPLIGI